MQFKKILEIKADHKLMVIDVADILYIKASVNDCYIHMTSGSVYKTRSTSESMEAQVGEYFLKVHRTYLVCIMAIRALEDTLILINGEEINYATRRKKEILAQLQEKQKSNQLMSGSIRDIITFSDKNRTGDEAGIHRALQIACADGFIAELEHGIDTLLGERGLGLSEGQMQRLAIARAIYSDRPVLLLDEATSAPDAGTEEAVLRNLRSMTDKTVIIVTHRPAALKLCDRQIAFGEEK